MMRKPLISVIVPVYNVEHFLADCVTSIRNQSYKNVEIILVDDGSTDGCPQICDALSLEDKRIKVIHKKNGGVSSARNAGLMMAEGDYVSFVDSDDYVHTLFIEILYGLIEKYKADISQCEVMFVSKKYEKNKKVNTELRCAFAKMSGLEAFCNLSQKKYFLNYGIVCNKLFSKRIVKKLQFPELINAEDVMFSIDSFLRSVNVVVCDAKMYFYFKRRGSATTSRTDLSTNIIRVFDYYDKKCYEIISDPKILNDCMKLSYYIKVDSVIEDYWGAYNLKNDRRKKIVISQFRKMREYCLKKGYKQTKKMMIFNFSPALYIVLRKIYRLYALC